MSDQCTNPLSVFLCHASGDKPAVREFYHRLKADGIKPWLDEEDLLPGQDWQLEIPKAVKTSDLVIVCLSRSSITKAGYVQKEIKFALSAADEQPEGEFFIIPVKLEECDAPSQLSRLQWVNLVEEKGYERLLRALRVRASRIGKDTLLSPEAPSPFINANKKNIEPSPNEGPTALAYPHAVFNASATPLSFIFSA